MLQINLISAESVFKSASYSAGLKKILNNFCFHILLALHMGHFLLVVSADFLGDDLPGPLPI